MAMIVSHLAVDVTREVMSGSHAIVPPLFPSSPGVACLQGVQLDNENVQLKALLQKCVEKGRATLHGTKP